MFEKIIRDAQSITAVSAEAAADYGNQQEALRHHVNSEVAAQTNIERLLGGNPIHLLLDNHLHHVRFMSSVFKLNNYLLLARIIPWVYRSYHNQGVAYEYFPMALQKWQESAHRFLQPASAAQVAAVYQWMLSHHVDFMAVAEDSDSIPFDFKFTHAALNVQCLETLLKGDYAAFTSLALQSGEVGNGLDEIYVNLLQPCLYEIGRLWETGRISVAQEHLSTAIVSRTMYRAFQQYAFPTDKKGKALIAAAPNEFHEIGAHMVADLLMLDGWNVIYLGANMPQKDLLALLRKERPFFLGLSAVLPFNLDYVRESIETIKKIPDLQYLKVMVGGLAFSHDATLWKTIGADGYASDGTVCVEMARNWWKQAADVAN